MIINNNSGQLSAEISAAETTNYVLIRGPSYGVLDFEEREFIRTEIREKLEAGGIRFVEYVWVWDEDDHCLLLVGKYKKKEDAYWWIRAIESLGFEICIRTGLPGGEQTEKE